MSNPVMSFSKFNNVKNRRSLNESQIDDELFINYTNQLGDIYDVDDFKTKRVTQVTELYLDQAFLVEVDHLFWRDDEMNQRDEYLLLYNHGLMTPDNFRMKDSYLVSYGDSSLRHCISLDLNKLINRYPCYNLKNI